MQQLLKEDMHNVMLRAPKDIIALMKEHHLMLGGGFIREIVAGDTPRDIDLFGPDTATLKLASMELYHRRGTKARTLTTKNAITHVEAPRTTVQFISRWLFGDPVELVRSFDFTVCQAVVYWQGDEWRSMVADRFYPDLASRRLVYTAPHRNEDAGGSLLRMRKFLGRGYHISAEELSKVIARLLSGVEDTRLFHEGETSKAAVLCGLLREVDPLLVVDGVDPVDVEHEDDAPEEDAPEEDQ